MKGASSASREAIDGLNQAIERQVGVLSRQLYPATLSQGLVPAFLSFADRFPAIDLALDEELARREKADPNAVPELVKLAVYRIAEEALTNAAEHARAGHATVRLDTSRAGWLRLTVRDDGQGIHAESAPAGLGVATMQDYADAVGGQCVVHSAPGAGTEVTAVLPLSRLGAEHPVTLEKVGA
jgi:two-component system NarL family sensor kinase